MGKKDDNDATELELTSINPSSLPVVVGDVQRRSAYHWLNHVKDLLKPPQPISTTFTEMDKALNGGLFPGGMYVFAGLTGRGKSTFVQNLARRSAAAKSKTLLITLEDQPGLVFRKMISAAGGFPLSWFYHAPPQTVVNTFNQAQFDNAVDLIAALPLQLEAEICGLASVEEMIGAEARQGVGLVLLDQSSWISIDDAKTPYEANMRASRAFKRLARQLNIVIMVCVQISREGGRQQREGGRLCLHHLRDSGTWENDSDGVILIQNTDDTSMELSVDKHRHGPVVKEFFLKYDKKQHLIADLPQGFDSPKTAEPEVIVLNLELLRLHKIINEIPKKTATIVADAEESQLKAPPKRVEALLRAIPDDDNGRHGIYCRSIGRDKYFSTSLKMVKDLFNQKN